MAMTMPPGYVAPIDDSNELCGHSGSIAALFGRADYAWHYRYGGVCTENTNALALLELPNLPQIPASSPPTIGPSVAFVEGGQAVLRTAWSEDAWLALLIGEHGKARNIRGHEQPDATSFLLYALGENFAIDSGYGRYDERARVAQARNHSLILVDEKGPPLGIDGILTDANAWLSEFVDEPPFRSVRVDTAYAGATIRRRLAMIGEDYFAVDDLAQSAAVRDYAWLLQANAGGTTDGALTLFDDGGLIERPLGQMRVWLQSDAGPPWISQETAEHNWDAGPYQTHAVLRGEVEAAAARFLSLLLPALSGENPPIVSAAAVGGRLVYQLQTPVYLDVLLAGPAGDFDLPPTGDFPGVLSTDAEFAWVRCDPAGYELLASRFLGGTYLDYTPPR
jgi:hypothetical protein